MSYDLHVYAAGRLDPSSVESAGGWDALGIELHGPARVEDEDLPPPAAAVDPAPRWVLWLHAPAESIEAVWAIATALAEASDGIVYDPQTDSLAQSSRDEASSTKRVREQRIRLVELYFAFDRGLGADDASSLLALMRTLVPFALPTRYGDYEPLQHRLDEEGENGFARAWLDTAGQLIWRARRPAIGGTALSMSSYPPGPTRFVATDGLLLKFDGDALEDGPTSDAVAEFFVAVAERLTPLYGAGLVRRNVVRAGGHLAIARDTENNMMVGRYWLGLPPFPVWLTWFGSAYATRLDGHLPADGPLPSRPQDGYIDRRRDGIFLRVGRVPQDADQLAGGFPALPAELLRGRDPVDEGAAAEELPVHRAAPLDRATPAPGRASRSMWRPR